MKPGFPHFHLASEISSFFRQQLINVHLEFQARGLDVLPTTISRFRAGGDEQTARLLEDIIYPEEVTHCAAGVRWFRYLCLRSNGNHPTSYPVPELEPRFFLLPGDGTADGKTAREAEGEPTPILAKDVSNDDKMVQQVEDELPSRIAEDANGQVKAIEHVEDGLAKCKLDDSIDKDEEAVIRIFHGVVREYFRGPLKPPFNTEARKAAGFEPAWYEPLAVKEACIEGETIE